MAPKRQNPLEVPPTVSSSEEEEEASSEEESEEEPSKILSPSPITKKPENSLHTTSAADTEQTASSCSASSEESEADDESKDDDESEIDDESKDDDESEADDAEGESDSEPETPTGSPIRNVKPMESVTKSTGKRPSEQPATPSKDSKMRKKSVAQNKPEFLSSPVEDVEKTDIENDSSMETIIASMDLHKGDLENFVLNEGMGLIKGERKAELEAKWKQHRAAQLELYLQKIDLMRELVFEGYKSDI